MKKQLTAALAASSLALPLFAADSYPVDPNHTFASYEVTHLGYSTQRGRFDKTSGTIVLDRDARTGSVDITIDAASINIGNKKLEEHLRSEDFFAVERFPKIIFKSNSLKFKGGDLVAVEGDLTMRGVTMPVTLAVSRFRCAPHLLLRKEACGADASATVKRSDFHIRYAIPAVADEVKIVIAVEAIKD
jgi:polyisoprenoid-binding protein YceI